jgi:putative sigma-54 modulation protein
MNTNGNGNSHNHATGGNGNRPAKLEIRADNIEINASFRQYIEEKIDSLGRIWPRLDDAHVRFIAQRGTYAAEVTLVTAGLITRGEERADDPRAAFDFAFGKIERQLHRYKKKALARERRHDNRDGLTRDGVLGAPANVESVAGHEDAHEEAYATQVRTKRFAIKPMSAEEAALQMDLLGHNFFVFRDAASNEISVVYKRRSGGFGLIEPILD